MEMYSTGAILKKAVLESLCKIRMTRDIRSSKSPANCHTIFAIFAQWLHNKLNNAIDRPSAVIKRAGGNASMILVERI